MYHLPYISAHYLACGHKPSFTKRDMRRSPRFCQRSIIGSFHVKHSSSIHSDNDSTIGVSSNCSSISPQITMEKRPPSITRHDERISVSGATCHLNQYSVSDQFLRETLPLNRDLEHPQPLYSSTFQGNSIDGSRKVTSDHKTSRRPSISLKLRKFSSKLLLRCRAGRLKSCHSYERFSNSSESSYSSKVKFTSCSAYVDDTVKEKSDMNEFLFEFDGCINDHEEVLVLQSVIDPQAISSEKGEVFSTSDEVILEVVNDAANEDENAFSIPCYGESEVIRKDLDKSGNISQDTSGENTEEYAGHTKRHIFNIHNEKVEEIFLGLFTSSEIDSDHGNDDVSIQSIPSLSDVSSSHNIALFMNLEQCTNCKRLTNREIANSAIAWGAFAALLGSSTPLEDIEEKKRCRDNLWMDDENSYTFSLDLQLDETSHSYDEHSLPSIISFENVEDVLPGEPYINHNNMSDLSVKFTQANSKEDATNAFIAFSSLAALCGTSSSPLLQKSKTINLWTDSDGIDEDNVDLLSLSSKSSCDYSAEKIENTAIGHEMIDCDDFRFLALPESEGDYGDSTFNNFDAFQVESTSLKGEQMVDSTVVWGTLAAFLGSSSSFSPMQKRYQRSVTNLWKDHDEYENDVIPSIQPYQSSVSNVNEMINMNNVHNIIRSPFNKSSVSDDESIPSLIAESEDGGCPSGSSAQHNALFQ